MNLYKSILPVDEKYYQEKKQNFGPLEKVFSFYGLRIFPNSRTTRLLKQWQRKLFLIPDR